MHEWLLHDVPLPVPERWQRRQRLRMFNRARRHPHEVLKGRCFYTSLRTRSKVLNTQAGHTFGHPFSYMTPVTLPGVGALAHDGDNSTLHFIR